MAPEPTLTRLPAIGSNVILFSLDPQIRTTQVITSTLPDFKHRAEMWKLSDTEDVSVSKLKLGLRFRTVVLT